MSGKVARSYVLPDANERKRPFVEALVRMYADFFGAPTRQALIAQWWQTPAAELERVHKNWTELTAKRAEWLKARAAEEAAKAQMKLV